MRNKRLLVFLSLPLLAFSVSILGCSNNQGSTEETETDTKYEKDEEGFFILEDDYFKHIDDPSSRVEFASKSSGVQYATKYRLYYGDIQIPVYECHTNPAHTWSPNPVDFSNDGVAILSLSGKAKLTVQTNFYFARSGTKMLPLDENIEVEKDQKRRTLTFEINKTGHFVLSLPKNMSLHLFVNPINGFTKTMTNTNVITFSKGLHNKNNSSYIGGDNLIRLNSNTTVILERGAVVEAGFIANNASNIEIVGEGIVSGARFSRDATSGSKLIPYEFNYCNNLVFKGITTLDPAGWCYNLYFSTNITLEDIKIISSRSNGDGVSIQSCQTVTCSNSFVRTWDDSLVVKNYPKWSNRNEHGTTRNIRFDNCQIWTDLAQSMEVGYETVGEVMEDIYFTNIHVLYATHKAVMSIHNGNNAHIKNVHFENITVDYASIGQGDGNKYLIDFVNVYSPTWSDQHTKTSLGFIDGVTVKNVKVNNGVSDYLIHISGVKDSREGYDHDVEHYVKNVTIDNLIYEGVKLTSSSGKLSIGDYVYQLTIR